MAKVDWDAQNYDSSAGYDLLPKGSYPTVICDVEMKETKDRQGKYLEVEFEVVKGKYVRRKLWARLNVHNKSETAQRIGREQFNALCEAVGIAKDAVQDTNQLINKWVTVVVSIEEGRGGQRDQNRVNGFMKSTSEDQVARATKMPGAVAPPPTRPAVKPAATQGSLPEDDIPF